MRIPRMSPSPAVAHVIGTLARRAAYASLVAISLGCTDQSRLVEPPRPKSPPPEAAIPLFGTLVVRIETSGEDIDPDGFMVHFDGPWDYEVFPTAVANNGTVNIGSVSAGNHTLTLYGVADNCAGESLVDRPIVIAANVITTILFQLGCTRRGVSG